MKILYLSNRCGHFHFGFHHSQLRPRLRQVHNGVTTCMISLHSAFYHLALVLYFEKLFYHLFFDSPLSMRCWNTLNIHWGTDGDRFRWLSDAKNDWAGPMFMDMFVVAAWSIWKDRNGFIFKNSPHSHASWLRRFKEDFLGRWSTEPSWTWRVHLHIYS